MSDTVAVAVISALGLLVQTWMAFWVRRLEKNTNAMKDELVKLTGEAEHAKGVIQGKADANK